MTPPSQADENELARTGQVQCSARVEAEDHTGSIWFCLRKEGHEGRHLIRIGYMDKSEGDETT